MKNKIVTMLTEAIEEQGLYLDEPVDLSKGDDSILYADSGQLDSLSLITIISDIEKQLFASFDVKVILANERDLSIDNSPFKTFGKMVGFIEEKLLLAISNENYAVSA